MLDKLNTNAYRTLGLSANASLSEGHNAATALRRMFTLGLPRTHETDFPILGAIPRTETDIRAAVGRLQNPVQRLRDRLFWFCQPPNLLDSEQPRPASQAQCSGAVACDHDEAL